MKLAPNLNFTVIEPTKKALNDFVQMLKNVYQNVTLAFNGNIGFGDGTNPDNINGSWINVTTPVAPNTDFTVNHNLQRIPSGYWIMQKDRACDLYTGSVAATSTQITFKATVASAVLRIFVVGIILSLFAARNEAQGVQHYNIALKSVTPSGSSGIGGPVAQPINGATITVCLGSTPPAAGSTCSPATNIFSSAALTNALPNPFNADVNGNYTFFAAGGVSYIVSVGAVGFTTFSYVWNAPINTSANLTLSGNLTVTGLTTLATTNVASLTSSGAVTGTALVGTSVTDSALTSGNCVQATTGGLLTTASGPCGTSSGTITATGSPAAGNLTKFSGATSITNADLAGDVTTSGTTTTVVGKVNGVSYSASPATNTVPIVTASNTITYVTLPNCLDSAGQHLNYNNSTFTFVCGTSTSSNFGRNTSVCTTGSGAGSTCTTTVNLNFTEPDTNYSATATCVGPSQFPFILGISKSTTSVTVTLANGTSNEAQASTCSELDVVVNGT